MKNLVLTCAVAVATLLGTTHCVEAEGYITKVTLPDGSTKMIKDTEARQAIGELNIRAEEIVQEFSLLVTNSVRDAASAILPPMVTNLVDEALTPQSFSLRILAEDKVEGADFVATKHVMNYMSFDVADGVTLSADADIVVTNRTVTGKHNYSMLIDKFPDGTVADDMLFRMSFAQIVNNGYQVYCNLPMDDQSIVTLSPTNLPLLVQFDEPTTNIVIINIGEMKK